MYSFPEEPVKEDYIFLQMFIKQLTTLFDYIKWWNKFGK